MARAVPGLLILIATGLCTASTASADTPDADGWVPGVIGSLLLTDFGADGRIESTVGQSTRGTDELTATTFQLGLELSSPPLEGWLLSPRLVGQGGILLGPEQTIELGESGSFAVKGEPESGIAENQFPFPNPPPNPPPARPASAFDGQGSEISATVQGLGWFAGLGVVLEMPEPFSRLRLRPTVSYLGQVVDIEGKLVSVTGTRPTYVIHRIGVSETQIHHFIGPGIETELMLYENAAITFSAFGHVSYYWQLGEDSFSETRNGVRFHYSGDTGNIRGGAGIRVSWRGLFQQD